MRPLKSNLTRLALAGAFVAGLAAVHPAPGPATPLANSLSTEQARKLTSPVDGDRDIQMHPGQPVVRNVSFQRYRP